MCLMLKSLFYKIIILAFIVWAGGSHKLYLFFNKLFLLLTRVLLWCLVMKRCKDLTREVDMRRLTLLRRWRIIISTWLSHDRIIVSAIQILFIDWLKLIYLYAILIVFMLYFTKWTTTFASLWLTWNAFQTYLRTLLKDLLFLSTWISRVWEINWIFPLFKLLLDSLFDSIPWLTILLPPKLIITILILMLIFKGNFYALTFIYFLSFWCCKVISVATMSWYLYSIIVALL